MYGIIYRAYNKVNGKNYIGQTIHSLEKRKKVHYSSHSNCVYFHNALMKYDEFDWEWSIIDQAESAEELDNKEKYWIAYYKSFGNGYNLTAGGRGSPSVVITEEHKRKTRETMLNSMTDNYNKTRLVEAKIVKCLETNKVYLSLSSAARDNNTDNASINRSIKTGRAVKGLHWQLIEDPEERLKYLPNAIYCVELDKFYENYRQARCIDRFHEGHLRLAMNKGDPYEAKSYAGYTFYWVNPLLRGSGTT